MVARGLVFAWHSVVLIFLACGTHLASCATQGSSAREIVIEGPSIQANWSVQEAPYTLQSECSEGTPYLERVGTSDHHSIHDEDDQLVCQECRIQTPSTQDVCRKCKAPWQSVWKKPNRRSKSAKRPKETQEDTVVMKPSLPGDPMLLTDKLPWITSTPQARVQRRVEEAQPARPMLVPPPPPVEAPPLAPIAAPKATLNAEDQQLLANLRNLSAQITLPEELAAKMNALEAQQKQAPAPSLSHSQVNRLSKLRTQLAGLADKVTTVDQEWQQFIQAVMQRVHNHVQAYQTHRQSLVDTIAAKREELKTLKEEIQQASMVIAQPEIPQSVEETPDLSGTLAEIQRLSQSPSLIPTVNLEQEEEEGDHNQPGADTAMSGQSEEEESTAVGTKPTRHTTYRQSPNRSAHVAKDILKTKDRTETEKQEKQK